MNGHDKVEQVQRFFPTLEAAVEPMTEAVLVLNRSGLVVAVNDSLLTLLDLDDRASALRPIAEYGQLIREWRLGDDPFVPEDLQRSLEGASIGASARHSRRLPARNASSSSARRPYATARESFSSQCSLLRTSRSRSAPASTGRRWAPQLKA